MPNRSTSDNASDFVQMAREFTDMIRTLRPEDLTDADRAALHSLIDTLKELALREQPLASQRSD